MHQQFLLSQPSQRTVHSSQTVARFLCGSALGFVLLAGCASTPTPARGPGPVQGPRGDTTISLPPELPGLPAIPAFALRSGRHTYDIQQTTIISVGADSLTRTADTLLTTGLLTYEIHSTSETVVIGTIDSLSVLSRRDTIMPIRRLAVPITVHLEPEIGSAPPVPSLDSLAPAGPPPDCGSMEDAARTIARDAHIRIPPGARPGQQWADSSSMVLCRGGIPMTATTVSTFEVQDTRGRGDARIGQVVRRSTLTLSGSGLQGSRRIAVTGSGNSESLFSYDLAGGAFLESSGQSILRLRFETIQQTEVVLQSSSSRIRLRP